MQSLFSIEQVSSEVMHETVQHLQSGWKTVPDIRAIDGKTVL